jgi:hypothetical protein
MGNPERSVFLNTGGHGSVFRIHIAFHVHHEKGKTPGIVNDFHHPYRLPERHADPGVIAPKSGRVALAKEAVDLVLTGHGSRACTPVTVKAFPKGVKDLFLVHLVVRIPVRVYSDAGEPDWKKAVPVYSPYHVRQLRTPFRLTDRSANTGKQADRQEKDGCAGQL